MGKADPSIKPVTQTAGDLYLEELTKAAKRIGDTTDSAGAWLARFAQTNLQELSTGGWTDLLKSNLAEYQYQSGPHPALWSQAVTFKDWKGSWRYKEGDETLSLKFLHLISETGRPIGLFGNPELPPP